MLVASGRGIHALLVLQSSFAAWWIVASGCFSCFLMVEVEPCVPHTHLDPIWSRWRMPGVRALFVQTWTDWVLVVECCKSHLDWGSMCEGLSSLWNVMISRSWKTGLRCPFGIAHCTEACFECMACQISMLLHASGSQGLVLCSRNVFCLHISVVSSCV